jgi:6-phosphogluconolactonase (cycloisomerase 2 family)
MMFTKFSVLKRKFTGLGKIVIGLTLGLSLMMTGPVWAQGNGGPGAVYAMTNAPDGNEIVVYERAVDGTLTLAGTVVTGGEGGIGEPPEPVDALGAQNPLILSKNNRWLFAVNAGSNEISVFRVTAQGLTLVDIVASGGDFPVSLTHYKDLLYVLNSGGDGNITGFIVDNAGHLTPLAGSTRSLNAGGTNPPFFLVSPAQVGFSPKGDRLVVTEKGSNAIHVFAVDADGLPSAQPVTTISNGFTPFGFTFGHKGRLIVGEAFGAAEDAPPPPTREAGAVSSYEIASDGSLQVISASVENFQTATCWLVATNNNRYGYATNNASDTITGYRLHQDGSLSLLNADGVTAMTGDAPVDLAITGNGRFLYNVNAFSGTVSMFQINKSDGSLTALGAIGGLPVDDGAVGLAAR